MVARVRRMVRRKRVVRRKRMVRRKAVGRSNMKRTSDYAKCVEIQETAMLAVADAGGNSTGAVINFCLADYQRPQEIAHAYKYYRAAKVEITFIPYYNIAQTGGGVATRLPQLYFGVDRLSNRWIAPTENECLERGMSPKIFTRRHKLTFKPNLLQEISLETQQPLDATTQQPQGIRAAGFQNATCVFDKWLPTQQSYGYAIAPPYAAGQAPQTGQILAPIGVNPYALRYHGAVFCPAIEGLAPSTPVAVGDIQVKVTWEFKGPRALKTNLPLVETNTYASTSTQGPANAVPNTQPTTYPQAAPPAVELK